MYGAARRNNNSNKRVVLLGSYYELAFAVGVIEIFIFHIQQRKTGRVAGNANVIITLFKNLKASCFYFLHNSSIKHAIPLHVSVLKC